MSDVKKNVHRRHSIPIATMIEDLIKQEITQKTMIGPFLDWSYSSLLFCMPLWCLAYVPVWREALLTWGQLPGLLSVRRKTTPLLTVFFCFLANEPRSLSISRLLKAL